MTQTFILRLPTAQELNFIIKLQYDLITIKYTKSEKLFLDYIINYKIELIKNEIIAIKANLN